MDSIVETASGNGPLEKDSNIAVIAYLTIFGLIIAFIMTNEKKDPFARYHMRQVLGLCAMSLGFYLFGMIPVIGWLVSIAGSLFMVYLWAMGLMNAINKKTKPVPFLGQNFNEWFKAV